jgi:hypothetical protein
VGFPDVDVRHALGVGLGRQPSTRDGEDSPALNPAGLRMDNSSSYEVNTSLDKFQRDKSVHKVKVNFGLIKNWLHPGFPK